eukprot:1196637-Rhodomonas_salina.1
MPPRKPITAHPLPGLNKRPRHDEDRAQILEPRAPDLATWLRALEGTGAVWNRRALRFGDVVCTA